MGRGTFVFQRSHVLRAPLARAPSLRRAASCSAHAGSRWSGRIRPPPRDSERIRQSFSVSPLSPLSLRSKPSLHIRPHRSQANLGTKGPGEKEPGCLKGVYMMTCVRASSQLRLLGFAASQRLRAAALRDSLLHNIHRYRCALRRVLSLSSLSWSVR